jgi:hypothetical protein
VEGATKATLVGGFGRCFPNALAMLRLPAVCLADFSEVLCDTLAAFLSLGILDFVEVHHLFPFPFLFVL